jgi:hypothetical protein
MTLGIYFFCFIMYLILFIVSDKILGKKVQGKYYLIHFFNNLFITFYTYPNVIESFTDLYNYSDYITNPQTIIITIALHIYHIIIYFNNLRFDDWLHHILMIGVVVPTSIFMNVGSLLGLGLFFITGLPGGIDYFLLFLVRNKIIDKLLEKKINTYLNIWIRCPGCIIHSTMATMILLKDRELLSYFDIFASGMCVTIIFWNGVYFMNQVVQNYAITNYLSKKN